MKKISFYLALLLISTSIFSQTLEQGVNLFGQAKFDEAYPIFFENATKGDSKAQGYLAKFYAYGLAGKFDPKEAAKWTEKGVQKNDPISQDILGSFYFYGLAGYPLDKEKGILLTTKSVNQDYYDAKDHLSTMIFSGKSLKEMDAIEVKLTKEKSIAASALLESLYENHRYKPANSYKAIPYAMEAFKRGGFSASLNILTDYPEYLQFPVSIHAGWLKLQIDNNAGYPFELTSARQQLEALVNKLTLAEQNEISQIKLPNLISKTNNYLQKRQKDYGPIESVDLINEGWEQFVGVRGQVNEPLAQYLTEEGLRKAILIREKDLIDIGRNNLGVILGAAVNPYVRNKRLAQVHIIDGGDSEFGPDNLIWFNYEGKVNFSSSQMQALYARYLKNRGEEHITLKLGPLPESFENKPDLIIKFLTEKYNSSNEFQKSYQLAEQIADMYEDNYFDVEHLKEAKRWYEIRNKLNGSDQDERLKRIEMILSGQYVKDTPNLRFAIDDLFEIKGAQQSSSIGSPSSAPVSLDPKTANQKLNVNALVIGNSAYSVGSLSNALNDSKLMAEKFKSYGFNVTYINNVSRKSFVRALMDFSEKARDADVTILYYSGHGMQLGGVNYLLPIDIDLKGSEDIVALDGISLNDIERRYMPGKSRLIFLDACRSKPFKVSQTRGGDTGLAPVNVSRGTLISFATKDGGVAFDGAAGKNSPYTGALASKLDEREDISLVLRSVRDEVIKATQGKQEPWEYGSLSGGKLVLSSIATQ